MISKMTLMTAGFLMMAEAASAGFSAQGLTPYYLPNCAPTSVSQAANGAVWPRRDAPGDAASWLANRNWDVRSYKPCSAAKPAVKHGVPGKKAPANRVKPRIWSVPQK